MRASRTATIHIGTEKTGSTTIQWFLQANREVLAAQGTAVPDFLDWPSQRWLPAIAQGPEVLDDFMLSLGLVDRDSRERAIRAKALQLRVWAHGEPGARLLVSSEHLSSRLTSADSVGAVASILGGIADESRVVVYVREPISAAMSYWSTQVRAGQVVRALGPPAEYAWLCDYAALLSRWEAVFPDRVEVRLFGPGQLCGDDLIEDFCAAVGIARDPQMRMPKPANPALRWPAMKVLNAVNASIPGVTADGGVNPARGSLGYLLDGYCAQAPRYRPSSAEVEAFNDYFSSSDEWVRRTYFPDRARLWTRPTRPRAAVEDGEFAPELTPEEAALARDIVRLWSSGPPRPGAEVELVRALRDRFTT